jgi:acetylornithine deacetylase/succinyl-diaminopimelate desuccinylase-like protein
MHALRSASLTAVVLLLVCAALVLFASRPAAPLPATAPPTAFSAERAMRHVHMIAQRPHPNGSADLARVREYLVTQLTTIGLEPQIQQATGIGTRYPVAAQVQNVLARLPGRNPGRPAILLVAHYDGVGAGPAAGDNAAGVAALLETLRALRAGPPLAHDVIVLFTDGEEAGLAGAAAFVREHPWSRDVAFILNFEGRGTRGLSLMFETGTGNLDAVRVLRQVPEVSANSLSVTVYRALPNDTDLSELAVLGQPALNFR